MAAPALKVFSTSLWERLQPRVLCLNVPMREKLAAEASPTNGNSGWGEWI
jgi:hypothetical protein